LAHQRTPIFVIAFQALLIVAAFWLGGFVYYASGLATHPPEKLPKADGIVTLTGGSGRLDLALDLLREGNGQRLLISGVNADLSEASLRVRLGLPAHGPGEGSGPKATTNDKDNAAEDLFACCIDVDRAENTIGNANEIAEWATRHDYHSLIIVTASYHLPRSLLEISRQLPKVELVPYPVISKHVKIEQWYKYPGTARLLAAEYTKYLASLVRLRLIEPLMRSLGR
jgi:uncharacterized SAM-binding protein YcdF (DUF218 family)